VFSLFLCFLLSNSSRHCRGFCWHRLLSVLHHGSDHTCGFVCWIIQALAADPSCRDVVTTMLVATGLRELLVSGLPLLVIAASALPILSVSAPPADSPARFI
jgi:hypothetical protein